MSFKKSLTKNVVDTAAGVVLQVNAEQECFVSSVIQAVFVHVGVQVCFSSVLVIMIVLVCGWLKLTQAKGSSVSENCCLRSSLTSSEPQSNSRGPPCLLLF